MTAGSSSPSAGSSGKAATQFKSGNSFSFRPGTSGNPSGRSKLLAQVEKLALSHAPAAVEELHRLVHHSRSERVRVAAAVALLDRAMGKPAVKIIADDERPLISTIQNLIVRPDGSMAEVGGFQPSSPIDRATASDAELVASDAPAEGEGPGPEGETSRVDLRRVLDAVTRAQGTVAETKRELAEAKVRLARDGRRLTEAEERQRREREAQARPNGSADDSWY